MSIARQRIRARGADPCAARRLTGDPSLFLRPSADFVLSRVMRFSNVPPDGRERCVLLRGLFYGFDKADIYANHEVWVGGVYLLPMAPPPEVIVDLGANIGMGGLWLARRYGCTCLIVVEPPTQNSRIAVHSSRHSGIPTQVKEAAVASEDSTAVSDEDAGATTGSLIDVPARGRPLTPRWREARALNMSSLVNLLPKGSRLGLVGMDVEGGEQILLTEDVSWPGDVCCLVVELHTHSVDYPRLTSVLRGVGPRAARSTPSRSDMGDLVEVYLGLKKYLSPECSRALPTQ